MEISLALLVNYPVLLLCRSWQYCHDTGCSRLPVNFSHPYGGSKKGEGASLI